MALTRVVQSGRFKLTGVSAEIGTHGILAFLVEQRWTDVEVLYVGEQHSVFLAGGVGTYGPMNYAANGSLRQMHFTALNSQAKAMVKEKSMASSSVAVQPGQSRAASRKSFFENLTTQQPLQGQATSVTSPIKKPEKRGPAPTGETPTPKERKET